VSSRCTVRCFLAIAIGAAVVASQAAAQDALSAFMKAKLDHSQKTLSLLCEDEMWAVLKTPEYQQRSDEFRRSVNAITDAARKKNLEAATLAYVDATMKCVSCHKYVRQTRMPR
jgi:hypothetical protein